MQGVKTETNKASAKLLTPRCFTSHSHCGICITYNPQSYPTLPMVAGEIYSLLSVLELLLQKTPFIEILLSKKPIMYKQFHKRRNAMMNKNE